MERPGEAVPARQGHRRSRRTAVAFAVGALVLVAVPVVLSRLVAQPDGEVHRYEIPAGTGAALARGEAVEILPAELELGLRDTLVLVNLDDQLHQVGPLQVPPGEEVARSADDLTSFTGFCSLHPAGRIDIQVGDGDR